MKKILLIICTLIAFVNNVRAQVIISTSDLNNTKWQLARVYRDQGKDYNEYTLGEKKWHKGNGETYSYPYYLSNTIVTKFDYGKVGKNTKGSYYVEINPKYNIVVCYSIESFDKTSGKMVMRMKSEGYSSFTNTFYLMPIDSKKYPRNLDLDVIVSDMW